MEAGAESSLAAEHEYIAALRNDCGTGSRRPPRPLAGDSVHVHPSRDIQTSLKRTRPVPPVEASSLLHAGAFGEAAVVHDGGQAEHPSFHGASVISRRAGDAIVAAFPHLVEERRIGQERQTGAPGGRNAQPPGRSDSASSENSGHQLRTSGHRWVTAPKYARGDHISCATCAGLPAELLPRGTDVRVLPDITVEHRLALKREGATAAPSHQGGAPGRAPAGSSTQGIVAVERHGRPHVCPAVVADVGRSPASVRPASSAATTQARMSVERAMVRSSS